MSKSNGSVEAVQARVDARLSHLARVLRARVVYVTAARGQSVKQACVDAGYPPHTLYRVLGRTSVTLRQVVLAAEVLGVPASQLLPASELDKAGEDLSPASATEGSSREAASG